MSIRSNNRQILNIENEICNLKKEIEIIKTCNALIEDNNTLSDIIKSYKLYGYFLLKKEQHLFKAVLDIEDYKKICKKIECKMSTIHGLILGKTKLNKKNMYIYLELNEVLHSKLNDIKTRYNHV